MKRKHSNFGKENVRNATISKECYAYCLLGCYEDECKYWDTANFDPLF